MSKVNLLLSIGSIWVGANICLANWAPTGSVNTPRAGFMAAVLTDGKVLIIGGKPQGGGSPIGSYEIFDPSTGNWTIGNAPAADDHSMAILLPNGRVWFITQEGNTWFYESTSGWSQGPTLGGWRVKRAATLLKNGRVLLIDYENLGSTACDLYDCFTGGITPAGNTSVYHANPIEALLPNGDVLVAGGMGGIAPIRNCDRYNYSSNTWSACAPLRVARAAFCGVLLPPPWSKVLVAGRYYPADSTDLRTELYDPIQDEWTLTGNLNNGSPSRNTCCMVLLPSGEPILMGGGGGFGEAALSHCEIYSPASGDWTTTTPMSTPRGHFSATILHTGRVLAISGYNSATTITAKCEIYDPSEGIVEERTSLIVARAFHTTTPLPIIKTSNCSTNVLIVGGENTGGALQSCEIYNYQLDVTVSTDDLNTARSHHTAILLPSGNVLVAGGKNGTAAISSCEIFNISNEEWATINGMANARFDHTATLLKNGNVLVTGGEGAGYLASCEIYNGSSWSPTDGMTTARARHCAVLLLDGRVMVIGGETSPGVPTTSCEIWDGTNWSPTGSLNTARSLHTAILLQNGNVLVIGGRGSGGSALQSCEIYDVSSNQWSPIASLNHARHSHNAVLLYSGLVLVTGGHNGNEDVGNWEVYDPAIQTWKSEGPQNVKRHAHTSVLVPELHPYVLMVGGKNDAGTYLNSVERYDVGLGYWSQWQPQITNHSSLTHISSTMRIHGRLFRGVSEADGGNQCHIVSSDHPIISLVRVGGGNWQGNGGGEVLFMPRSSCWSIDSTIVHPPSDAPEGHYRLWAIVNGIPSKWYEECVEVEEEEAKAIHILAPQIFPNPSTGSINFRISGRKRKAVVEIYDCMGRMQRTLIMEKNEIKISGLKAGVYFYKIKDNFFTQKGKFIVL